MAATMATDVRSSEVTTQHVVTRSHRLYSKASPFGIEASPVSNDVGVSLNVQLTPEIREVNIVNGLLPKRGWRCRKTTFCPTFLIGAYA